jgi:hypothetical protein
MVAVPLQEAPPETTLLTIVNSPPPVQLVVAAHAGATGTPTMSAAMTTTERPRTNLRE